MIRIKRKAKPPRVMLRAATETAAMCQEYDRYPQDYRNGTRQFDIEHIYGTKAVKRHLKEMQNHKCCYCEGRFDAYHAGDVEHYRPKGAVEENGFKIKPGYYWLAYDWNNLYYACPDCNEYRKGDRFPLTDPAQRARHHGADLSLEDPLLLDPCGHRDPRDHIRFSQEQPIFKSAAGDTTIREVGLDRENLMRERRLHLYLVEGSLDVVALLSADRRPDAIAAVRKARNWLRENRGPASRFWSATQDLLSKRYGEAPGLEKLVEQPV